jgi:uncharacterized protein YhjY with autotransporter beta-barrel domain
MSGNIFARGSFLAAIGFIFIIVAGLLAHAAEPPSRLPDGVVGQPYSVILSTDTGNVPPVHFQLWAGVLPPGITLTTSGPRSMTLSGTPTTAGEYDFEVRVTDSDPDLVPDYSWFHISVALPAAPVVTDTSVTTPFNTPVDFDVAPLISGDWDSLMVTTAGYGDVAVNGTVLTFTPQADTYGPSTIQFDVWKEPGGIHGSGRIDVDVQPPAAPVAQGFSVNADAGQTLRIDLTPHVDAASLVTATIVNGASQGAAMTGGANEIIYESNPDGDGADSFTYTVTDTYGQTSALATINVTITPATPPIVIQLPAKGTLTGKVGETFSESFPATGGTGPYGYIVVSGSLPAGLHLEDDTVSGTPTDEGAFTFILQATDQDGNSGVGIYTVVISPADPVAGTPSAADFAVDADYNGPPVNIDLGALVTDQFDTVEIVTSPSKGTVSLSGAMATYTPSKDEFGDDAFIWKAIGPGGTSNNATVAVTIKQPLNLPVAVDHVVHLGPGESGKQDLTVGATGAPFLKAHIVGGIGADKGTASVTGTVLHFTPSATFSGAAKVGYQLENAAGISNTATVTFMVAARPDPSDDPEVIGLLTAQQEAAKQLADDQISTITGRLERLHSEGYCQRESSIDLRLGYANKHKNPDDPSDDSVNLSGKTANSCNLAVWGAGYVSLSEFDRGGTDFSSSGLGFTVGADYRFSPSFVGGVAVGYGRSQSDIGSHGTETAAEAVSAALYASWHRDGWFVDGLLGYQHLKFDNTRYVTANGQMAHGSRSGDQVFGSLLAGYEIRKDGFVIAPYVGVRGSAGTLNGYSEAGGGIYGLTYGDQRVASISGVVGVRVEKEIQQSWGTLTPSARIEYRHDFVGGTTVHMGYTDVGDLSYKATVPGSGKDSVRIGVGVKAKLKKAPGWSIEGTLSHDFGGGKTSTYVGVRATYEFCGLFTPASACGPQKAEPVKAKTDKGRKLKKKRK